MANTQIQSEQIANNAIDANKLSDDAVTIAKLNVTDGSNGQVLKLSIIHIS